MPVEQKIVFLDAATVDYGDIDFSPLENLGEFIAYSRTTPDEAPVRSGDASVVITNKVVFDRDLLRQCPELKHIAVAATGYNTIDITEARTLGISVSNVPGYSTGSVAQLTMTFILALASNLVPYDDAARNGQWSASPLFTLGDWPFIELEGRTAGILGYGSIGKEVARLCRAFNMQVIALKREGADPGGDVERCPLHEIAARSDFVSVHMPLSDYSHGLIGADFIGRMKKSAFLINMARGPIVDPGALRLALEQGLIAGAALDVMEKEPPSKDDPLLSAPNLIITPHKAWASNEARQRLVNELAENIASFLRGEKRNCVTG